MVDPFDVEAVGRELLGHLADDLREPGLGYREPPVRIHGGNNTTVYGFRLANAPQGWGGSLILRILRREQDPRDVLVEAAVQNALVAQGYPAPPMLLASTDAARLGGAFQVMERLPGRPLLLADMDAAMLVGTTRAPAWSWQSLRRGGLLAETVPEFGRAAFGDWSLQLARLAAALHDVDPEPARAAVEKAGFARERLGLPAWIDQLERGVEDDGPPGLRPAIEWLRAEFPDGRPCLCHCDFFPNQIVAENGVATGVIDWSDVRLAPAGVDVGITVAGIETLALPFPGPIARAAAALPRWHMRRFLAAYRQLRPLDEGELRYGEVLRCVRILLSVARRRRALAEGRPAHADPYDNPIAVSLLRERVHARAGLALRIDG